MFYRVETGVLEVIITGTIKNSVSLATMESKWEQRKQNLGKHSGDMTAEERMLQSFQEQADSRNFKRMFL